MPLRRRRVAIAFSLAVAWADGAPSLVAALADRPVI
jgi:hypothetical protein